MRALFAFFVAFGLISCVFAAEISGPQPTLAQVPLIIETAKGPARFTVEMATTPSQQERGLMFRKDLIDLLHNNPMSVTQIARFVKESPGEKLHVRVM